MNILTKKNIINIYKKNIMFNIKNIQIKNLIIKIINYYQNIFYQIKILL